MGIMAEMVKRTVVFYAGRVAEVSDVRDTFRSPKHPYTAALLNSVPRVDRRRDLTSIPGNIPNLITPPSGCRYHPRCSFSVDKCVNVVPELEPCGEDREVSCHRWKEIQLGSY